MKRYLVKERPLTPEESFAAYLAHVKEKQEEVNGALAALNEAIVAEPLHTTTVYVEVHPGEPGYEDAPFTNTLIVMGSKMAMEVAQSKSPWPALLKPGVYPEGLGNMFTLGDLKE